VVNDRVDLAQSLHADGVHLGQDDLPVGEARRLAGEGIAIGVSTHSVEQARKACREGADYIGIGPIFPTSTKVVGPALGIDGFRAILREANVPAFAVGGITPANIEDLATAGARRAAVSSAILTAGSRVEAREAARAIIEALCRHDADRDPPTRDCAVTTGTPSR
jgi:thiamine-phosphate pyrophosphorylase